MYDTCRTRITDGTVQMSQIHLEVEEDVAELLGSSPEQIERSALEMIVLELYRRRELSAGRAGELLGIDRFAFIRWSGALGIPYLDMTPEEWQQELRVLEKL
jgi:predicted HTH domain antitoxin